MEKQENETLFYMDIWNNEEQNNEQARIKSFKKSQQDKEVLKEQYEQDITEIDTTENPNCLKKLPVKCINKVNF